MSSRRPLASHDKKAGSLAAPARRPASGEVRRLPELVAYTALFFLVALAYSTNLSVQFTLPKLVVIRTFAPVLGVFWAFRFIRNEVEPPPRAVLAAAVALSLWWIATTIFAVHQPTAIHGAHGRYNGLWTQLLMLSLFLMIASSRFAAADVERLTMGMTAALVPTGCYALVQYAGWDPIPWPGDRSASTIGNPVILAATLALGMPFALAFLLRAKRWGRQCAWGTVLVILLAAAVTTLSRGPLLAAVTALIIVCSTVAWEFRHRLTRMALIIALILTASTLMLGYRQIIQTRARITSDAPGGTTRTIRDRLNTYRAALEIIRHHPIVGVGLENYGVVYPQYRSASSEQLTPDVVPTMVHNGYLQAAATTGIPGLLAYLALISSVLLTLVKDYRRETDRRSRWFVTAFAASIAGYLIQDLSGWLEISLSLFFWIILGLAVASRKVSRSVPTPKPWIRPMGFAGIGTWLAVTVWLAAQSVNLVRADSLMRLADGFSVSDSWPLLEDTIRQALQYTGEAIYSYRAAVRYAERWAVSGDAAAYRLGAGLFDEAHRHDPFNPYFIIERVRLDAAGLQRKTINDTPVSDALLPVLLAMDRNNASVYEAVARFRLAQGRVSEALDAIEAAKALRPAEGRYLVLEGDMHRASNDRHGAIVAYDGGLALLPPEHPEWLLTQHKRLVTLIESGMYTRAVEAGKRLTARQPSDAMAFTLLGYAYAGLNDLAPARQAFGAALEISPGDGNAVRGLTEVESQSSK
jgi:putative inorganic carbon (HCO3(-)) transporter